MSLQDEYTLDDLLEDRNTNPEFRKQRRATKPYYDLIPQIINRRNQLGLTQKDLAERAHTFQSRISKIESAEHDLRISTLIEIAEALEMEVEIKLIPLEETVIKQVQTYHIKSETSTETQTAELSLQLKDRSTDEKI